MLNRIFLIGNLTRDPEVRYLPSGMAVTSFDLAVNERYRDRNQEMREETLFIRVDTFQRLAEMCGQYLKKGKRVFVEGKLRSEEWEGKDGMKRTRMSVRASNVRFLDPKGLETRTAALEAGPAAAPPQAAVRPSETPSRAMAQAPATLAEADVPYDEGLPEQDVNADPFEARPEGPETTDDLPF
ncbi:MAG: single-stranded DNA-binding protein [Candidatus Sumerlaeia bacterium]|nr:single-stranded DNA-binding protein [Candidatus Sumerlaeia bacterium]